MTHTALHYAHKMPCTTHASMHSAPLRKKSDALRSSARSGYLMRRLRHAVSRPCDAICAVLETSAVLRVVRLKGGKGLRAMCSAGLDAPMLAIVEVWPPGVCGHSHLHPLGPPWRRLVLDELQTCLYTGLMAGNPRVRGGRGATTKGRWRSYPCRRCELRRECGRGPRTWRARRAARR